MADVIEGDKVDGGMPLCGWEKGDEPKDPRGDDSGEEEVKEKYHIAIQTGGPAQLYTDSLKVLFFTLWVMRGLRRVALAPHSGFPPMFRTRRVAGEWVGFLRSDAVTEHVLGTLKKSDIPQTLLGTLFGYMQPMEDSRFNRKLHACHWKVGEELIFTEYFDPAVITEERIAARLVKLQSVTDWVVGGEPPTLHYEIDKSGPDKCDCKMCWLGVEEDRLPDAS